MAALILKGFQKRGHTYLKGISKSQKSGRTYCKGILKSSCPYLKGIFKKQLHVVLTLLECNVQAGFHLTKGCQWLNHVHNLTTLYRITQFTEHKQCTTSYRFMGPSEPVNTIPNVDLLVAWSMTGILVAGTTWTVVCWVYIMPGQ